MNIKHIMIMTMMLIIIMSSTAAALIETDWEYGERNPLPDASYIRYDFESEGTHFNAYAGVVDFVSGSENKWASACIGGRGYHIYPMDFFYNGTTDPRTQVNYIYIVNGQCGAQPVIWRCTNVKCEWWPGSEGMIMFPDGASDVSFLVSTGKDLEMSAYDKNAKLIGTSGVAHPNIERVPPNPSEFTRVSFKTSTPIIHAVIIHSDLINFWVMDDLVIGGLTFPDEPVTRIDYGWAAERMRELIGAKYHPFGLGYILETEQYLTADEIKNKPYPIWNPATKEMTLEEGICPEAAVIWAFNLESNLINNLYMNDQEKKDFKEEIAYEDIQPGDVFFIDYPVYDEETELWVPDGQYDEVGVVIPPQYDQETGMLENCIRVIPEAGVHYGSTEFINALYGTEGFVHYRSLPDAPKGPKSPYPKIPSKFYI